MNIIEIPSPNFFPRRQGHTPKWIIIHGTAGGDTAQDTARYFQTAQVASNYVIGRDGTVVQCVSEDDGAWANGGVTGPAGISGDGVHHDAWWDNEPNPNDVTISIEHVKASTDNSDQLTNAQQAASFALQRDICKRRGIPMRKADAQGGITGHYSMDPINKSGCPGPYPWSALWAYLKGASPMSEVCSVTDTSQFAANKSTQKCGFYAISLLMHAGRPGQAPKGNAQEVSAWADSEYVKYDGVDTSNNGSGMTVPMEYMVINDAGLHYQGIGATETGLHTDHLTSDYVRAWVHAGYPVLLSMAENTVYDLDLGGSPYAWDTTGLYHVITVTGVASDNNLLVHDTASIDTNGVRPGPRRYDAGKLQQGMISATAVVLPWLARPNPDFDPIEEASMFHFLTLSEQKDYFVQTKAGHDDSWTCTKNKIVLGGAHLNYFRYNGGVETFGLPQSVEEKIPGAPTECTAVLYERGVNFYDPHNVVDRPADSNPNQPEKRVYRAKTASGFGFQLIAGGQIAALNAEIATLEAQLKAAQAGPVDATVTALKAKLAQVETLAGQIAATAKV